MAAKAVTAEDLIEFDWLKLKNDMDEMAPTETRKEKLLRKIGENPFVPMGKTMKYPILLLLY